MNTIPKSISPALSSQDTDQIRLQRVIQQRKRMEYMSSLICQQKQSITILREQNHQLSQSFCELKLQNQLLKDKLNVATNYNEGISQVLVKQISLLESFRQLLLGTNLNISQQERQILLEQIIQSCYDKWQSFNRTQKILPSANKFDLTSIYQQRTQQFSTGLGKEAAQQIARLTDQNQQLNEKYQQLCNNYFQLSKEIKLKQLQISQMNKQSHQNNSSYHKHHKDTLQQHNCGHIRNSRKTHTPSKNQNNLSAEIISSESAKFYQRIIKEKDSQIAVLTQKINQLKLQQQKKDQLIKQHRKNQKQQKKLLHFLKTKFNLEGKQLSQIASHHRIKSTLNLDGSPSKIQASLQNCQFKVSKNKGTSNSPSKQIFSQMKFKNQNLNAPSFQQNKLYMSNKKEETSSKRNDFNNASNNSGIKKTLLKNSNDM